MRACTTLCTRVHTRSAFSCAARRQLTYKPVAVPRPPLVAPSTAASIRTIQSRKMVIMEAAITPMHIAIGAVGVAALLAWVDAVLKSKKPELIYQATAFNNAVMSRCPTLRSVYQCTPFLTNGHVETILVAKLRKPPGVDYRREIILTKDGGAVAIDWEHVDDDGKDLPDDAPVLILFPGLTGGSGDSYVQHAVLQARHAGIRAAVFNSRGTADSPVITPQFYSASFTDDTREVVAHVHKRYPNSTLFAAGWSLGANILVNYLGEQGSDTPLEAAVSMCNPFDLTISNKQINEGFNKIYNWNLAASLKRIFAKHELVWRGHPGPAKPQLVPDCKTIREFDEAITVHSFDWPDVDAYYAGSSSAKRIPAVKIPLLCIQALDDPIAPAEAIPCDAIEDNPNCLLAVTPCGGHLGWASGPGAPFNHPWTDNAVVEWLTSVHIELMKRKQPGNSSSNGHGVEQQQDAPAVAKKQVSSPQRVSVSVSATAGNNNSSSFVAAAAPAVAGNTAALVQENFSSSSSTASSSQGGRSRSAAGRLEGLKLQQQQQQQELEVDAAPALAMEQMWWGEIKSPKEQQQQQGFKPQAKQQRSSSSSTWGSSAPSVASSSCSTSEPVTGADVVAPITAAGSVLPGTLDGLKPTGGQHLAVAAVAAAPSAEPAAAARQFQVIAADAGVAEGPITPQQHKAPRPSDLDVLAAADLLTAQLRWAF